MLKTRKIISMFFLAAVLILSHSSCNREEVKAKNDLIGAWKMVRVDVYYDGGASPISAKYGYIEFFEGNLFSSTFDPILMEDVLDIYSPSGGEFKLVNNQLKWVFTNEYFGEVNYTFDVKSISNVKLELVYNYKKNLAPFYKSNISDLNADYDGTEEIRFTLAKLPNGIPAIF
jgi:hypothetical protein